MTVTEVNVTVTATPEGPMRAGDPATIAVSVSGFTPTTARLHYRAGGATGGYASVPLASRRPAATAPRSPPRPSPSAASTTTPS